MPYDAINASIYKLGGMNVAFSSGDFAKFFESKNGQPSEKSLDPEDNPADISND
jgi:hypothetical protein